MHTPEFDFEALVRSMGMADIQSAVNAAAKKVAEEQEAARKAAEEAERKRREAEAEAEARKREEEAKRASEVYIKRITVIANAALNDSLTADDVAFILRRYAHNQHPDFPTEDLETIFDAETIENYVDMTTAIFGQMKFLLPSGASSASKAGVGEKPITGAPSILNFDDAFKQLFPDHKPTAPTSAPKSDDEVLRSFVNRIIK